MKISLIDRDRVAMNNVSLDEEAATGTNDSESSMSGDECESRRRNGDRCKSTRGESPTEPHGIKSVEDTTPADGTEAKGGWRNRGGGLLNGNDMIFIRGVKNVGISIKAIIRRIKNIKFISEDPYQPVAEKTVAACGKTEQMRKGNPWKNQKRHEKEDMNHTFI
ncbi:hypothetical protein Cantr_09942 [Candida viswanathii]|uniref:Uncharacterized protein n=1 Tax=Candida viswanathii TaxID=5486 RepID=A0A367YCZ3_9ASCO|nr:hypothetical protein Cantr_09942 [Candida viswanathii]